MEDNGNTSIYKAIILGCLLIPLNCYWVVQIEMGRYLAYPTCISLFFNVIFNIFILLALNVALIRLLPRFAFTSRDLLLIYVMLSIATAISAAETGHLVLGTLHTTDAAQTVDRIVDIFPPQQQQQIRLQLSQVIEAVLVQTLLPRLTGKGRIAAFEIMTATAAVRNLIREHKTFELPNVMQLSAKEGMQTLDQALANLVRDQVVSKEEALIKSSHPDRLDKLLQFQQSGTLT